MKLIHYSHLRLNGHRKQKTFEQMRFCLMPKQKITKGIYIFLHPLNRFADLTFPCRILSHALVCRKLWMRRWEEYVGTRTLTRAYQNGMRDSAKPHSVREQVLQWEVENLKKIVVFGQKIKFKTILRSLVQVVLFTAMSSFKDPILQHCTITTQCIWCNFYIEKPKILDQS